MSTSEDGPVTVQEVARYFGVAVSTVRRWVREGRIQCIRPSRKVVRFHLADVEAALARRMEADHAG